MKEDNADFLENSLNMLLEDSKPISKISGDSPEDLKPQSNIDLLDESKESPEVITPGALLTNYTSKEKEIESLNTKIEEFKAKHKDVFSEYQKMLDEISNKQLEQSSMRDDITKSMENAGLKTISNETFKVTYVAATKKSTFDRKGFEAKYPVLSKQFIIFSDVKSYVKITGVK